MPEQNPVALSDPIQRLFDETMPAGSNTRLHLFSFEAESGRERLVLVLHGSEAELLLRLILQAAEPVFDKAEVH